MNKIRKRRYNHELRGLHFALSVILYYISIYICGFCAFGGVGLLTVGLIMLNINFYIAIYLISVGCCLIAIRLAYGRKQKGVVEIIGNKHDNPELLDIGDCNNV